MQLSEFGKVAEHLLQQQGVDIRFGKDTLFSLPVVLRRNAAQYDAMFLYPRPPKERDARAPRPFAWLLLDAGTGKVALLCRCDLVDFMPPGSYAPDAVLSMTMERQITARKQIELSEKLMETYEEIRSFAFEENLSRAQAMAVSTYKDLFSRLTYPAHYPFYHGLSPAFFHWLRMPLPEEALLEPTRLNTELSSSGYEYLILQNLQQLVRQFQDKIADDAQKERILDDLHRELQQYKSDFHASLTLGLERDIIQVIDDIDKSVSRYRESPLEDDGARKLLALLEGVTTDLEDLLYRHGVEPYTDETLDISRQKILATVPTDDAALDKRIAKTHVRGWEKGGKVIRPQRVSVYMADTPEPQEPKTHEALEFDRPDGWGESPDPGNSKGEDE